MIQWIISIYYIAVINVASIDLNLLIAFDALMRERNVTRAAARIGLAQPSMSNALSRLRALFGDELFVRTPSGMRPTARAEEIATYVSAALDAVDLAVNAGREFDPVSASFTIRLAANDYVDFVWLPEIMARLRRCAPRADLRVLPYRREVLSGQLDRGDIDMAIGRLDTIAKRHMAMRLCGEEFVCIARKDHPSIGAHLDLETFLALPQALISQRGDSVGVVDAALAEKGQTRRVALTAASFVGLPFIVGSSDLIAVVPRRLAERAERTAGIEIHPAPIAISDFDLTLVWDRGTDIVPAQRWFRTLLRETFASGNQDSADARS